MVGSLAFAALGAAVVLGHRRQQWTTRCWAVRNWTFVKGWRTRPPGQVLSALIWAVLIGGIIGWDLASFAVQSHSLPTLSYFIGRVTRFRVGRGLFFALWLGTGVYLVTGRRLRSPR